MIISIHPKDPQPRLISQAVQHLKKGAVICYPTDTGYGLGCDLFNPKAVKRLYQLKKRPANKPFSIICSDLKDISRYAHVSNTAYRLLKRNLPGAYTFVLPGTKLVPKSMLTKQKTVGIRMPDHNICRQLVKELGNPLINTSVQTEEDELPLNNAREIQQNLSGRIDVIIDGEPVFPNPSSIIDLIGSSPAIIRAGQGDPSPFQ
ncbi:MAG: threonylcarbamoyl-AMP synthase [Deltaproteobacteria bacterium]|nr:MAG: threonylcarbamoyl-AMP synthase [Deltaproteobacteria bacterium]